MTQTLSRITTAAILIAVGLTFAFPHTGEAQLTDLSCPASNSNRCHGIGYADNVQWGGKLLGLRTFVHYRTITPGSAFNERGERTFGAVVLWARFNVSQQQSDLIEMGYRGECRRPDLIATPVPIATATGSGGIKPTALMACLNEGSAVDRYFYFGEFGPNGLPWDQARLGNNDAGIPGSEYHFVLLSSDETGSQWWAAVSGPTQNGYGWVGTYQSHRRHDTSDITRVDIGGEVTHNWFPSVGTIDVEIPKAQFRDATWTYSPWWEHDWSHWERGENVVEESGTPPKILQFAWSAYNQDGCTVTSTTNIVSCD